MNKIFRVSGWIQATHPIDCFVECDTEQEAIDTVNRSFSHTSINNGELQANPVLPDEKDV